MIGRVKVTMAPGAPVASATLAASKLERTAINAHPRGRVRVAWDYGHSHGDDRLTLAVTFTFSDTPRGRASYDAVSEAARTLLNNERFGAVDRVDAFWGAK